MKEIDLSIHRKNTKELDISKLSMEAYAANEQLQVQEILEEKKKTHEKMMNKIIDEHQTYDANGYYILVLSKKDFTNNNIIKTKYIVRSTKPEPDWSQDLYYYSNRLRCLYFIYSLPKIEDTIYFSKNWDLFKEEWIKPYMNAINAMKDGSIRYWDAPCNTTTDLGTHEDYIKKNDVKIIL